MSTPQTPLARECYELRVYRIKAGSPREHFDNYVAQALVPALNRRGVTRVGVFTERDIEQNSPVYVLIPFSDREAFFSIDVELNNDPEVRQLGADHLNVDKDHAVFERIDSWLLLAFSGFPKLELPEYSAKKMPRIFELRTYESYSEITALKKVEMFNSGEIDIMRECKMAPIFYGQALIGSDLPRLTYMLSAPDDESHKKHWTAFRTHPRWEKMKNDPRYADTVSKITSRFLVPTAYSQI